ncbi:hypothetical protein P5V15_007064 [Pogonomyrmex californicus]
MHSMLYFFHHYELPVILQQAQLQQLLFRNHAQPQAQPATPSTNPTTPGPESSAAPSASPSPSPSSSSSPSPNPSTPTTEQTQQNYITELSQLDSESNDLEAQHANADTEQTSMTTTTVRQDDSVPVSEDRTVPVASTSVAKAEVESSASGAASPIADTSSSEGFEVIESVEMVRKEASTEDKKEH